ncbi:hypothetical protein BKA80DRAFT_280024 [Phyllosticta citrichinensis]
MYVHAAPTPYLSSAISRKRTLDVKPHFSSHACGKPVGSISYGAVQPSASMSCMSLLTKRFVDREHRDLPGPVVAQTSQSVSDEQTRRTPSHPNISLLPSTLPTHASPRPSAPPSPPASPSADSTPAAIPGLWWSQVAPSAAAVGRAAPAAGPWSWEEAPTSIEDAAR